MRWTPIALLLLMAACACQAPPPAGATRTPERSLDASYPLSGRVVQLVPGGIIVASGDRQIQVSFGTMVDVWKETSVPTGALEVGDNVFISDGHVFANIGRIGGVIRAVDPTGMVVDLQIRSGDTTDRLLRIHRVRLRGRRHRDARRPRSRSRDRRRHLRPGRRAAASDAHLVGQPENERGRHRCQPPWCVIRAGYAEGSAFGAETTGCAGAAWGAGACGAACGVGAGPPWNEGGPPAGRKPPGAP